MLLLQNPKMAKNKLDGDLDDYFKVTSMACCFSTEPLYELACTATRRSALCEDCRFHSPGPFPVPSVICGHGRHRARQPATTQDKEKKKADLKAETEAKEPAPVEAVEAAAAS